MDIDARELIILSTISGVGTARLRGLVNHFGGTGGVFQATAHDLSSVEGLDKRTAASILSFLIGSERSEAAALADAQLSKLNRLDAHIVTVWDESYPINLRKVYDPPPFLFARGTILPRDEISLAVVGTRNPSPYGSRLAGFFAQELARLDFTVVSGLARGIDTLAHEAVLKAGGRTIAVIGSGLDVPYPPENIPLGNSIVRNGAIISEYLMGTQPDAVNFPRRNRIISGMTLGTLVIETGIEGGAMITASMALDQNREVFALPGPIGDGRPSGTHLLIKEGRAKLTESVDDILAELDPSLRRGSAMAGTSLQATRPRPELSLFEQKVLDAIGSGKIHVDDIAISARLSSGEVLVELLNLELKGLIRQQPGKIFSAI